MIITLLVLSAGITFIHSLVSGEGWNSNIIIATIFVMIMLLLLAQLSKDLATLFAFAVFVGVVVKYLLPLLKEAQS